MVQDCLQGAGVEKRQKVSVWDKIKLQFWLGKLPFSTCIPKLGHALLVDWDCKFVLVMKHNSNNWTFMFLFQMFACFLFPFLEDANAPTFKVRNCKWIRKRLLAAEKTESPAWLEREIDCLNKVKVGYVKQLEIVVCMGWGEKSILVLTKYGSLDGALMSSELLDILNAGCLFVPKLDDSISRTRDHKAVVLRHEEMSDDIPVH